MRLINHISILAASTLSIPALGESGALELRYRFNQPGGLPSDHEFILKWADTNSNLQSITVVQAEGGKTIQTIEVPQDRVQILWRDLVTASNATRDKVIDYTDYNFDQLGDIRLTQRWPYRPGQKKYLVWLYDQVENTYKLAEEISRLAAPVTDAKAGLIHSTQLGAYGGGEYVSDTFSVAPDGGLTLETRITQTIKDPVHLSFTREIQSMNLSRPRTLCRFDVPAEGKPRITWGLPETCDAFLTKTAPLGIPVPSTTEVPVAPEAPEKQEKPSENKKSKIKPKGDAVAH